MNKMEILDIISKYDLAGKRISEECAPAFHIYNPGFINDPNGLCYFKGYYHVFFQYSPCDGNPSSTTPKCWRHFRTKDFVKYEDLNVAIMPDTKLDESGSYSGSAIVINDTMHLFYTGNVKLKGDYDYIHAGRLSNTITVKSLDGVNFTDKQLVLSNKDYPLNYTNHIRDPKMFIEDGLYKMILGARTNDDKGCAVVYKSSNLVDFGYDYEYYPINDLGYMWECPDVIMIGGKKILSICPQGVKTDDNRFHNENCSGYFLNEISFDGFKEWDTGYDFYAPQTFNDGNRVIQIGWAGVPDPVYNDSFTLKNGFRHMLTYPRELTILDGKLIANPIEEIEKLHDKLITLENNKEVVVGPSDIFYSNIENGFIFNLNNGFIMRYDGKNVQVSFTKECGDGRTNRSIKTGKLENVRILLDRNIIEIFFNNGENVFTSKVFPNELKVKSNGFGNAYAFTLKSIDVKRG